MSSTVYTLCANYTVVAVTHKQFTYHSWSNEIKVVYCCNNYNAGSYEKNFIIK